MPTTLPRVRATLDDAHRPTFCALKERNDDVLATAARDVLGNRDVPTTESGLATALLEYALEQLSTVADRIRAQREFEAERAAYAEMFAAEAADTDDADRAVDAALFDATEAYYDTLESAGGNKEALDGR